jgi:hypothetical protein
MKTGLLIVSLLCAAPLLAQSSGGSPPPVDVTVDVNTQPIADQMSSLNGTMNSDFSGLSSDIGTMNTALNGVEGILSGGFSGLMGGLFGGLFGPLKVQDNKAIVKLLVEGIILESQLRSIKDHVSTYKRELKELASLDAYRNQFAELYRLGAQDSFGNIGALVNVANTGLDARAAYSTATIPVELRHLSGMEATTIRRVHSTAGDMELADGSNRLGWTLVGDVRSKSRMSRTALDSLMEGALHSGSTKALAQNTSAATALGVRYLDSIQQVTTAQLEQQIEASQRQRDQQAQIFETEAAATTMQTIQGMTDSVPF